MIAQEPGIVRLAPPSDTAADVPDWIEHEIRARRARFALDFSRPIGWVALAGGAVTFLLWLFNRQYTQFLVALPAILVVAATSGLYPVLYRRGKPALGAHIFLLGMLLVIAVDLLILPQAPVGGSIGYALLILLSVVLLGPRGARWFIALSTLSLIADITLVHTVGGELFEATLDTNTALLGNLVLGVISAGITAVVARRVVMEQEASLAHSMSTNHELDTRAADEQERRRGLEATIAGYTDFMGKLSAGNLALRLPIDEDDVSAAPLNPLLRLGWHLNHVAAGIQTTIAQVHGAASDLSASTAEILVATGQQVAGGAQQSAAIGQTTATIDEVKVIADQAVARAQEVADASHRTVEISLAGRQAVRDTIDSMNRIQDRVQVIADNILALSAQTQQIGNIIATVNDIAAQSNMLALNAAVEAARAGEQGKGFAIVAQEVRSLADQSRQATAQVRTILQEIQAATNATVMATEEGNKRADEGVQLAAQAGRAIEQLAGVIDESAQAAVQMVAGGRQQATGIEQVALAMQSINQATAQGLATTRQTEETARNLDTLARRLAEVVEAYEL